MPPAPQSLYIGRRPRILLADDHLLVAEAVRNLLEPEFDVIGVVPDGNALLHAVNALRPDLVIMGISMPGLNGLDAGEQIKQKYGSIKLLYLTMLAAPEIAAEAFRRGASAYVLKHSGAEELLLAIRRVLRGESYLSSLITRDTVEFLIRSGATYQRKKELTSRQQEVLQLLVEGKSMSEIARILHIRPGSVAFHKYRMMEKLGIKTNAALLDYGIRHQMSFTPPKPPN